MEADEAHAPLQLERPQLANDAVVREGRLLGASAHCRRGGSAMMALREGAAIRALQQSRNSVPYAELRMALSHSTPTIATRAHTGGKRACGLELEMTLRLRVVIGYAHVQRMTLLAGDGTSLAQLVSSEGGARSLVSATPL